MLKLLERAVAAGAAILIVASLWLLRLHVTHSVLVLFTATTLIWNFWRRDKQLLRAAQAIGGIAMIDAAAGLLLGVRSVDPGASRPAFIIYGVVGAMLVILGWRSRRVAT